VSRDYAQRTPRRSQTRGHSRLPSWAWLAFGLSVGLAIAAFVYIARPAPAPAAVPAVAAEPPPPKAVRRPAGQLPLPPEEEERFTFYKDLKNQRIYIPRDERPPPAKPRAPADAAEPLYLIQVASFREPAEADREKARLALLGVEARIEKVTVDDRDTYYRVRVGPMSTGRAHTTLGRLQENGIQGMLVKAN
jgi:cell division protein FtsN